ncbi:hypothetical protein BGW39_010226 [Mortierella sp. 14UC]|nr:hypothetical protein BGW39_010226 [Mortierella sp. 14UC]
MPLSRNTTATSIMNTTIDARQPDTVYPQLSNNNKSDSNSSNNRANSNNSNNSEDDGEWVVKAPVKRHSRQRPSQRNNNENDNEEWNSPIEDEYEDDYMFYTEHELSKHAKATQLKNIRTHPGVPLAVRRKH